MLRALLAALRNLPLLLAWPLAALIRAVMRRRSRVAVAIRIRGELPYLRPPARRNLLMRIFRGKPSRDPEEPDNLRDLERDLAALAERPDVRAVIVHLEGFAGSGAALSALLRALEPLRKAGKKVYGYSRVAMTGEYRFLSQLDGFWLAPGGRLELTGYAAEVLSLKNALALAGVRPQFVRRGEYKTAPEMFTEERASPAQKRTLEAILDERLAALLDAMATGRKLAPEAAKAALDGGPYSARRAVESKLA